MGDFLIAYGSHTGQAETIAKGIKEKAELLGLKPRLFVLDDNEKTFNINEESFVAIVVSSTGDGDAPDNAARFVRRISRRALPQDYLAGLQYALLGLGDSNYSSYQAIPQKVDRQLRALGATRVLKLGEADDQVGLELAVEPWTEELFKYIAERFSVDKEKLAALCDSKLALNPVKSDAEKQELLQKQKQEEAEENGPEEVNGKIPTPILKADPYEYPEHSIVKGKEALSNDPNLRVPIASQPFVVSSVSHEKAPLPLGLPWQNNCKMVGVVTSAFDVTVVGTALVTDADAVKPKREIVVDFGEHAPHLSYEPGDALYFIAPNPQEEVNFILKRCGVLSIADQSCELSVNAKTEKINATLPGHVAPKSSLRHIFTHCLDVRRAPGRPLLRVLADSASNESEKRRLLELCSAQGMNDFTLFVRQAGLSVADVLFAFPSVKPPVDRLIELLPRLIPRPYSMSSYHQRRARFVYSQMTFTAEEGRRYERKGLATDWLNSLRVGDVIQVLGKEPARFRLPPPPATRDSAVSSPLLMVGPGTGVATFLSFCHLLLKVKLEDPENFPSVPRIMFFGCRDVEKDGIYIEELKAFVREGVLSDLFVCESQTKGERVQNGLINNIDKVLPFLAPDAKEHKLFICGDAKGMSKDVWQCFADILVQGKGISDADAKKQLLDLKKNDRYIEDVWA